MLTSPLVPALIGPSSVCKGVSTRKIILYSPPAVNRVCGVLHNRLVLVGTITGQQVNGGSYISDSELHATVQRLTVSFPRSGYVMMWGHLRGMGIHVTRRRVRETLLRVSASSVQLRATTTVRQCEYNVSSSNALWHIDGHHCLVCWRIVIHGGIDGHSRTIVYLKASDNNRAETVLQLLLEATAKFGWPSRVHSDCGGENTDVARAMIAARELGHWSHVAGASTHNQRIERLWRDTFRCVCHSFYSLFYEMEE